MNSNMSCSKNIIETVAGRISDDDLGYCQCHEHLFIAMGRSCHINTALYMDDIYKTTCELALYKQVGGCSLVDAQPVGCGRMAGFLVEASGASDVNIIASTGFHKMVFYDNGHWIFEKDADYLSQLFIDEINDGMYINCDNMLPQEKIAARAGIIKTAVDAWGIDDMYVRLFDAAAYACTATGVPIMCHIEKGSDAYQVVDFLTSRGVDAGSIILCHLDRARYDFAYHRDMAQTGVFLEYDTIGRFKYHSDDQEIDLISDMIEYGYDGSILLGLDTTNRRLKSYGGEIGLDYIKNSFIYKLQNAGIGREYIDKFTIGNPKRALTKKSITDRGK